MGGGTRMRQTASKPSKTTSLCRTRSWVTKTYQKYARAVRRHTREDAFRVQDKTSSATRLAYPTRNKKNGAIFKCEGAVFSILLAFGSRKSHPCRTETCLIHAFISGSLVVELALLERYYVPCRLLTLKAFGVLRESQSRPATKARKRKNKNKRWEFGCDWRRHATCFNFDISSRLPCCECREPAAVNSNSSQKRLTGVSTSDAKNRVARPEVCLIFPAAWDTSIQHAENNESSGRVTYFSNSGALLTNDDCETTMHPVHHDQIFSIAQGFPKHMSTPTTLPQHQRTQERCGTAVDHVRSD